LSSQRKPLHPAKAKNIIKALSKLGFVARHTKGSHVLLKYVDGRTTTVPIHAKEEMTEGYCAR
jgi:predicted RNA binding protein YcfA (HicA-like mRNA interferase family)